MSGIPWVTTPKVDATRPEFKFLSTMDPTDPKFGANLRQLTSPPPPVINNGPPDGDQLDLQKNAS